MRPRFKPGDMVRISDSLYSGSTATTLPKSKTFTVKSSRKTTFGRVYYSRENIVGTRKGIHEDWLTLVENEIQVDDLQVQMFWSLQLQFIQMEFNDLLSTYVSVKNTPSYKNDKNSLTMKKIMDEYARTIHKELSIEYLDEYIPFMATHLALQLSGIEQ